MYGIGARIAGRVFGYWTAGALDRASRIVAIPLFVQRYHGKYVEQTLPQTFGLTALADFPSMVLLLVAAYLVVRALDTRDWRERRARRARRRLRLLRQAVERDLLRRPPLAAFLLARRWRQLVVRGARCSRDCCSSCSGSSAGSARCPCSPPATDGTLATLGVPLAIGVARRRNRRAT